MLESIKIFKLISLSFVLLLMTIKVSAYDFVIDGIYYDKIYDPITGTEERQVSVTCLYSKSTNNSTAYKGEIMIPATVKYNETEYSVTSITDYAFSYCTGMTSVTIPTSITSIGNHSFAGCTELASMTIPNSITTIGNRAFQECSGLTSITIPNSVTSIGEYAFNNCSSLASVKIPNSVSTIADYAFYRCTGLTSVTIPNSVKTIGNSSFRYCPLLTSITIPNSVTSIGEYAFRQCSGLKSISIPNSLTTIGDYAFFSCTGLTSVTIPNSVTTIGNSAFSGCSGLTSVALPSSVTRIEGGVFANCTILASATIPNTVTSIEGGAFQNCNSLTTITIPNSVTTIGNNVFQGCTGLTSVSIPNSVASIGDYAFDGCTSLSSASFGTSLQQIGEYAFNGCSILENVLLPPSITNIGKHAFPGYVTCNGQFVTENNSGVTVSYSFSGDGYLSSNTLYNDDGEIRMRIIVPNDKTPLSFDCESATDVYLQLGSCQHTGIFNGSGTCLLLMKKGTYLLRVKCKSLSNFMFGNRENPVLLFENTPVTYVQTTRVHNDKKFPWKWNDDEKRLESTNQGVDSSESEISFEFDIEEEPLPMSYRCGVSSEESFDYMSGTDLGITGEFSGNQEKSCFRYVSSKLSNSLSFSYSKDEKYSNGDDIGWVKDLAIGETAEIDNTTHVVADVTKTYSISNVDELIKFRDIVNDGNPKLNAILENDITFQPTETGHSLVVTGDFQWDENKLYARLCPCSDTKEEYIPCESEWILNLDKEATVTFYVSSDYHYGDECIVKLDNSVICDKEKSYKFKERLSAGTHVIKIIGYAHSYLNYSSHGTRLGERYEGTVIKDFSIDKIPWNGEIGTYYNYYQWREGIANYQGNFDGQGHIIFGLFSLGSQGSGLFSSTNGATISYLGLEGGVVHTNCNSGNSHNGVGCLIGYAQNTTVVNCHNGNRMPNKFGATSVGGLIGYAWECKLEKCYNTGTIYYTFQSGGIVGYDYGSTITNCYNSGDIGYLEGEAGASYGTGGIVGQSSSTTSVSNCFNSGLLSGCYCIGGIVGDGHECQSVSNCYDTWKRKTATSYWSDETINGKYVTDTKWQNGYVAYSLDADIWKQTLGVDTMPNFTGKEVFKNDISESTYLFDQSKFGTLWYPEKISLPTGVDAYTISAIGTDNVLKLTKVYNNIIPAFTPVLLYSEEIGQKITLPATSYYSNMEGKLDYRIWIGSNMLMAGSMNSSETNYTLTDSETDANFLITSSQEQSLFDCYLVDNDKPSKILLYHEGDINGDGEVTKDDVTLLANYITGQNSNNVLRMACDINNDKKINVSDVTRLIMRISGGGGLIYIEPTFPPQDELPTGDK